MAHSINNEPLLKEEDNSDFEDDLDSGPDDPSISYSHKEQLIKHQTPYDRYLFIYLN